MDWEFFNTDEKGDYNTGFMGFKRDDNGLECLNWFRNKLIEWCFDKHENGLWSDQVNVNDWQTRFNNIGVAENIGINVTPWILMYPRVELGYSVTWKANDIYINDRKLILFHYYGFKYFNRNEFDLCGYSTVFIDPVIEWIYVPYIQACNEVMDIISNIDKDFYYKQTLNGRLIMNYFNLASNIDGYEDKYNFCPIISEKDLSEGLEFYNSLTKHANKFCLWICCLDDITYNKLDNMELENVILIDSKNIEEQELLNVKNTRNASEYRWTLKAPLVLYILKNYDFVNSLIYLDGDLYFFSDPKFIFNQWGDGSIYICEQRLFEKKINTGTYQAGLIGFKRDSNTFQCLEWWRTKCLEWCFHWHDGDKWTDQKYLDKWPELFQGVIVSNDSGINVGPWNVGYKESTSDINVSNGEVYINNHKLIVYHFTGFFILNEVEFDLCNWWRVNNNIINPVYIPYIRAIQKAIERIKSFDDTFTHGLAEKISREKAMHYYKNNNI